jgi:hypothetical protein
MLSSTLDLPLDKPLELRDSDVLEILEGHRPQPPKFIIKARIQRTQIKRAGVYWRVELRDEAKRLLAVRYFLLKGPDPGPCRLTLIGHGEQIDKGAYWWVEWQTKTGKIVGLSCIPTRR